MVKVGPNEILEYGEEVLYIAKQHLKSRVIMRRPPKTPTNNSYLLSNCWYWTGGVDKGDYGRYIKNISHMGIQIVGQAHCMSYVLFNKKNIDEDKIICHECDVPWCVNPEHLHQGTPRKNTHEGVERRWDTSPFSRSYILTRHEVEGIRRLYHINSQFFTEEVLAHMFKVSYKTVHDVINTKTHIYSDKLLPDNLSEKEKQFMKLLKQTLPDGKI